MTWTDGTVVPVLSLPTSYLDAAVQAVGRAQLVLIQAEKVEWESVAAQQYLAELSELHASVARLAHTTNRAHEKWFRARSVASAWGQL